MIRPAVSADRPRIEEIVEAAHRRTQELRAEAETLAADPDDRAEVAAILKDMENLRVW